MMTIKQQSGFTIMEALVAGMILMISVLGMGALQTKAMQRNSNVVQTTYAMEQIDFIADAIRSQVSTIASANAAVSATYNDFSADYWSESNFQSNYNSSGCSTSCSRDEMTAHMLAAWERYIGENLPYGKGSIRQFNETKTVGTTNVNTTHYEITVMWDARQMATGGEGGAALGTNCSGDPQVDLTCMKVTITP